MAKERVCLLIVLLSLVYVSVGQENTTCADVPILSSGNLDFTYWNNVVKALVTVNGSIEGKSLNTFDYNKLVNNSDYAKFSCQVENAVNISNFTNGEWKAFWINVYNYLAIRVLYENPCATDLFGGCRTTVSIKEVYEQQPSLFDVVWTTPVLTIKDWNDGSPIALDDIENDYLRNPTQFIEDVRIHGCIVDASVSSPDLRESAYTVENLEYELNNNVEKWLANTQKGALVSGTTVTVSQIFSWFADDFNNVTGRSNSSSVKDFLIQHAPVEVGKILQTGNYNLNYFQYDWHLNGEINALCKVNRPCFPWWALLTLILGLLVVVIISVICVRRRDHTRGYAEYARIQ